MNNAVLQRIKFNQSLVPKAAQVKVEMFREKVGTTELNTTGLGKASISKLIEAGVSTVEHLKTLSEDELKEILKNPLSLKSVLKFLNK